MLNPCETHAKKHPRNDFTPPTGGNVVELGGFVEGNVTYESHTFWVEFKTRIGGDTDSIPDGPRPTATLWVRHGGGVESLILDCHTARAMRDLIALDATAGAFHLAWGIFALARDTASNEARAVRAEIYSDFANGRLKKRKIPGHKGCKVWTVTRDGIESRKTAVPFDETP